ESADSELLDQYDSLRIGVVGKHADRVAALEDLSADFTAPAPAKQAVAETIEGDAEVSPVWLRSSDDLDGFGHCSTVVLILAPGNLATAISRRYSPHSKFSPLSDNFSSSLPLFWRNLRC